MRRITFLIASLATGFVSLAYSLPADAQVALGRSSDVHRSIAHEEHRVIANDAIGTVVFIHPQDVTTFGGGSTAVGRLRYDISTDRGQTFSTGVGTLNPTYTEIPGGPNVAISNPSANTNPLSASLVWAAPVANGEQVSGLGEVATMSPITSTENYSALTPGDVSLVGSLVEGAPGEFWSIGIDETANALVVFKGVVSMNDVVWTHHVTLADASSIAYESASIGFSPDGQVGWIATLGDPTGNQANVHSPVVYRSMDRGNTWGTPTEIDISRAAIRGGAAGETLADRFNHNFPYVISRLGSDDDDDGYCIGGVDIDDNGDCLGAGEAVDPVAAIGDCAEGDPAIHQGATEVCSDGIDNDCDQFVDGVDADCGGSEDIADRLCRPALGDAWVPPPGGFGSCGGDEQSDYAAPTTGYELDLTVDKDGNPHILIAAFGSESAYRANPSLGTLIVDVTTRNGGQDWDLLEIAAEHTWQTGLGTPDPGTGELAPMEHSLQIARNTAGTHIFYAWAATTTSIDTFGSDENVAPDLKISGYRLANERLAPVLNLTHGDVLWEGKAYWPSMSPIIFFDGDVHSLPITVVELLNNDQNDSIRFHYFGNLAVLTEADFGVMPMMNMDGMDMQSDAGMSDMTISADTTMGSDMVADTSNPSDTSDASTPDMSGADATPDATAADTSATSDTTDNDGTASGEDTNATTDTGAPTADTVAGDTAAAMMETTDNASGGCCSQIQRTRSPNGPLALLALAVIGLIMRRRRLLG